MSITTSISGGGSGAGGAGGGGAGDVVGPAASTDNALARFDGATGKLLQDGVVTEADTTGELQWPTDASIRSGAGNTSITLRSEGTGGTAFANGVNLQATMDNSGSLHQAGANGYRCLGVVGADGTLPAFIPDKSDANTGVGHGPSADQLSLIAGGTCGVQVNTVASGINCLNVTPGASGNPVLLASKQVAGTGGISLIATAPAATTGASVAGKPVAITASAAVASTDTAGAAAGGSVTITSGAAARNTSGNANGGDINLVPGVGIGTGLTGNVVVNTGLTIAAPSGGIQKISVAGNAMDIGTSTGNNLRLLSNDTARWNVASTTGNLANSSGTAGTAVVSWSTSTATVPVFVFTGDEDTGVGRAGADQGTLVSGGIEVARYSSGVPGVSAGITARRAVEANTAGSGSPNILAVNESRTLLTNEGATAENYHTLPTAAAGYEFIFYCQDADGIRVVANAGDTIRLAGSASAAAGFVRSSTIGSCITLVAINATEWIATAITGTWTVDV